MEGFIVSSMTNCERISAASVGFVNKSGFQCDERVNGSEWNTIKIPGAFNREFAGKTSKKLALVFEGICDSEMERLPTKIDSTGVPGAMI